MQSVDEWIVRQEMKLDRSEAIRRSRTQAESQNQMIKPKRSAEQQIADEADRRALNPLASRQTISESQAAPEFQENHKRLKADRLAREAGMKAKGIKGK
jgi:hypothetical protein